jgi:hypothetical protein
VLSGSTIKESAPAASRGGRFLCRVGYFLSAFAVPAFSLVPESFFVSDAFVVPLSALVAALSALVAAVSPLAVVSSFGVASPFVVVSPVAAVPVVVPSVDGPVLSAAGVDAVVLSLASFLASTRCPPGCGGGGGR